MKNKNKILLKFTVVAAMIGVFSPSVSVQTEHFSANNSYTTLPFSNLSVSLFNTAEARRGGGGRGGASRGGARSRPSTGNRNRNTNRNSNRNVNRNVNKNVNVNVNHNYYGGG